MEWMQPDPLEARTAAGWAAHRRSGASSGLYPVLPMKHRDGSLIGTAGAAEAAGATLY